MHGRIWTATALDTLTNVALNTASIALCVVIAAIAVASVAFALLFTLPMYVYGSLTGSES
jgi:hypothetical protein